MVAGFAYVSWTRTRFWFDDDGDLRIASGLLHRQERRVQLSRLQAVDVVQPIVARLVGLAELKPEVAGGESGKVSLAFLAEADAQALRNELLARAAGIRTGDQEAAPVAPERILVRVPPSDLALSLLISEPLIVGVVIAVVAIAVTVLTEGVGALIGLLFAVGAPIVGTVNGFIANYDFTVAESPDGLRLRRGLLTTRAQTVPPGRVQAIEIAQPLLWRRYGWVRLRVNIAGYGSDGNQSEGESTLLLPVAPVAVANAVLARVLPGVEVERVPLVPGAPGRASAGLDPVPAARGRSRRPGLRGADRPPRASALADPARAHAVRTPDPGAVGAGAGAGVGPRGQHTGSCDRHRGAPHARGGLRACGRPGPTGERGPARRPAGAVDDRADAAAAGQPAHRPARGRRGTRRRVVTMPSPEEALAAFDLGDPEVVRDPYPLLAGLRAAGRPLWHDDLGLWLAARHPDADAVLRSRRLGRIFAPREPDDLWEHVQLAARGLDPGQRAAEAHPAAVVGRQGVRAGARRASAAAGPRARRQACSTSSTLRGSTPSPTTPSRCR